MLRKIFAILYIYIYIICIFYTFSLINLLLIIKVSCLAISPLMYVFRAVFAFVSLKTSLKQLFLIHRYIHPYPQSHPPLIHVDILLHCISYDNNAVLLNCQCICICRKLASHASKSNLHLLNEINIISNTNIHIYFHINFHIYFHINIHIHVIIITIIIIIIITITSAPRLALFAIVPLLHNNTIQYHTL